VNLKRLWLGCVVLAFVLSWHLGEESTILWSKRLNTAQNGWQDFGYNDNYLDELAWYGDEGEAVNRKIGFYDDMADGKTQWMENRRRAAVCYFLRPSQIWLNDWQAFEDEAELIYVPSDDIIPFISELEKRELHTLFTKEESVRGFYLFWREGQVSQEQFKSREKFIGKIVSDRGQLSGGDPITGNAMFLRLFGGIIGWLGLWLGGVWLYRKLNSYRKTSIADDATENVVWEGWLGLGMGMLFTILVLFFTGMLGISGTWISFFLGIGGWILAWRSGILKDIWYSLKQAKMNVFWALAWLSLLGGLFWLMASKPAGDLAALWSTAVKSKMIFTHDGIGHWMYAGGTAAGGWADMQTHYPPGFPLLGSYLAWWGAGWHERACWLLPALLFASVFGVFVQILAKSMQTGINNNLKKWFYFFAAIIAIIIALAIFSSQWFWWLIGLFYAESLLIFFGLCGFGILFNNRESNDHQSLSIHDYLLAGAFLAGMGWVKNEGAVLFVLIASGYLIFMTKRQSWKKSIYLFVSAGLILLPWIICMQAYGLSDPFVEPSLLWERGWENFMAKSNEVWDYFYKMIAKPPAFYSGAWLISAVSIILGLCLRWNVRWRLLILWVIAGWFFVQCWIFSASTLEESSWHLPAMPRLWMLPTLLLVIIAVSGRSASASTQDTADKK
jgi:hypothetical protein